jgi:hypothetical protein
MFEEIDSEIDEPKSFQEAISGSHFEEWKAAIQRAKESCRYQNLKSG